MPISKGGDNYTITDYIENTFTNFSWVDFTNKFTSLEADIESVIKETNYTQNYVPTKPVLSTNIDPNKFK